MTAPRPKAPRGAVPVVLGVLWIAAGANFLALKVLTETLPPLALAALRLVLSTALLAPVALWRMRGAWPRWDQVRSLAITGVLLMAIGQTMLALAVSRLPAGVTAVLASSSPLFLALFAWGVLGDPLGRRQVAGVLLGFVGLVALAAGASGGGGVDLAGAGMVLLSSASWAAGSLVGERAETPEDPTVSLFVQLLTASAVVAPVALVGGRLAPTGPLDLRFWAALGYGVVIGSIMAFALFTWLSRVASSAVANTMLYVAPVVALVLGWQFLGETLTPLKAGSATLTLIGVALMISAKGKPATERTPEDERSREKSPRRAVAVGGGK